MAKKLKSKPKPFGDILIARAEGFKMPVTITHHLIRNGQDIALVMEITPKDKRKYSGEIKLTNNILTIAETTDP